MLNRKIQIALNQFRRKISSTTIWSYLRWARYRFQPRRFEASEVPSVLLEITNICNSKCVFCPYPIMKRKKEPMNMDLFKNLVDEVGTAGGKDILFCVTMGDPLLDPHLFERARYVNTTIGPRALGFLSTLQWLHRWNLDEFISLFKWVQVSTALAGPESYKKFFGVNLYQQMLANLESLLTRNRELGSPMKVLFSLKPIDDTLENVLNHPDFIRISKLTSIDLVTAAKDSLTVGLDDWNGAVKLPTYLQSRLAKLQPRAFLPCRMMYSNLSIASNGNVAPCTCRDYESNTELVIGNVKQDPLLTIWKGEKLRALRENWRTQNEIPPTCKTCRFYRP